MCKNPTCQTLRYLGDSEIVPNCYIGACVQCGAVRHGQKCNWRIKVISGSAHLIRRKEAEVKKLILRTPLTATPVVNITPQSSFDDILNQLISQGVRVK